MDVRRDFIEVKVQCWKLSAIARVVSINYMSCNLLEPSVLTENVEQWKGTGYPLYVRVERGARIEFWEEGEVKWLENVPVS